MRHSWTFLTSHAMVLLLVARERAITAQRLAYRLGLDIRSIQRVLDELESAGYITRSRDGKSNVYEVDLTLPMRRPGLRELPVNRVFGPVLFALGWERSPFRS